MSGPLLFIGYAVYWLCVLRGNKSLPKIDSKVAQCWRWGGGGYTLDTIQLATYFTNTRIINCTYTSII